MRDVPGPTGNAGDFPTIEPDGTSTSNPTLFPSPIFLDTFDNFYVGALDWVVSPKLFANVTVGLYDYGTHGGGAGEQLRHVFATSNIQSASFNFPEIPDSLRFVNGYADFPSSSVTKFDDFTRHSVNADLSYYANKWGQHSIKSGFQYERIGNSRLGGAQFPTDQPELGLGAERARWPKRARHLRLLHGHAGLQLRRHPHQRPRRVPPGRVDGSPEPHAQSRRPHRQRGDSVVHGGQSRHQVRIQGQDLAARRLRLGHPQRRQVEGLRQLRDLLRHLEARDAARPVRVGALGHALHDARHLQLARRSSAATRRCPARPARAPTSSRSTCGTPPTRKTTS